MEAAAFVKPTFLVTYHVDQLAMFAGTVDIIGLDRYPCKISLNGCDYSVIDRQAAETDRLGIRYWGVIQAHGDDYYKLPTPAELHEEFVHWRATNMEGYLVFSWRWPEIDPSLWLANHPELQAQLAEENRALIAAAQRERRSSARRAGAPHPPLQVVDRDLVAAERAAHPVDRSP